MQRLWIVAHCVLIGVASAEAQSLGEVAKKEKARRAKIEKKESGRVITEAELGEVRGAEAGSTAGESEAESETSRSRRRPTIPDVVSPGADPDPAPEPGSAEAARTTDGWDEAFAEYQKAYTRAKAYLQFAEGFQKHCKDGSPPPPLPPVEGGYWLVNCDSFHEDIAEARRLMREIQERCHNHARQLGVVPGRARLR